MLTLLKLGGSLITDKQIEKHYREEEARRIAQEIAAAYATNPEIRLIIGHGSGSFGHVAAHKHDTINGVNTPEQWRGFAEVATSAAALNALFMQTLSDANIPIWRIQPSASAVAISGMIAYMDVNPIRAALEHGIMPLVYGDVALDNVRGGTIISTETIFTYFTQQLEVSRIILVGEVDGVLDGNGTVIPQITPSNFEQYAHLLGGSRGTDVTGGMLTKVSDMLKLVQHNRDLRVSIINGLTQGAIQRTLNGEEGIGTLIHAPNVS